MYLILRTDDSRVLMPILTDLRFGIIYSDGRIAEDGVTYIFSALGVLHIYRSAAEERLAAPIS